MSAMQGESQAQ